MVFTLTQEIGVPSSNINLKVLNDSIMEYVYNFKALWNKIHYSLNKTYGDLQREMKLDLFSTVLTLYKFRAFKISHLEQYFGVPSLFLRLHLVSFPLFVSLETLKRFYIYLVRNKRIPKNFEMLRSQLSISIFPNKQM